MGIRRADRLLPPALAAALLGVSGCATVSLPERMVSPAAAVREAAFAQAVKLPAGRRNDLVYKRDVMDLCLLLVRGDGFQGTEDLAAAAMVRVAREPGPIVSCLDYAAGMDGAAALKPAVCGRFVEPLAATGIDGAPRLAAEMLKTQSPEREIYSRALVRIGAGSVPAVGKLLDSDRGEVRDLALSILTDIGPPLLAAYPKVAKKYRALKAAKWTQGQEMSSPETTPPLPRRRRKAP